MWTTTDWKGREGELVTVMTREEVQRVFGLRGPELRRRLQEVRDDGKLVCSPGRLTAQVRYDDPTAKYGRIIRRQYVLRGRADDYARPQRRVPVIMW